MILKTETSVAIVTKINAEEVYIKSFSKKEGDKYIPNFTNDPNLAHDFETEVNALLHIDRIINYSNHRYDPKIIESAVDTKVYHQQKTKTTV